ncbi:MAG TPA: hypothetical protein PLR83_00205 [Pyrinomonadaceae bacterium]|nr:hypothetical protein [Pyrinomonadaceae bacterium]
MQATRTTRRGGSREWRTKAYAAINICWKQLAGREGSEADREARLSWITEFLDLANPLGSLSDLSDEHLGLVAGELKRLTGYTDPKPIQSYVPRKRAEAGNVVRAHFGQGKSGTQPRPRETVFLSSHEQVYTLDKLQRYLTWSDADVQKYLAKRFPWASAIAASPTLSYKRLTFRQATALVNALLHIAAHRDLKRRTHDDRPVTRAEVENYLKVLKQELDISFRSR